MQVPKLSYADWAKAKDAISIYLSIELSIYASILLSECIIALKSIKNLTYKQPWFGCVSVYLRI